jgi:hypothetical protein
VVRHRNGAARGVIRVDEWSLRRVSLVCSCNGRGRTIEALAESVIVPTALVLNPRSDADFVAFAEDLLALGVTTPGVFQDRLRSRYPRAVVRERELASEPFTIWYCYRDGRWVRP